jgi:hypothetical protein
MALVREPEAHRQSVFLQGLWIAKLDLFFLVVPGGGGRGHNHHKHRQTACKKKLRGIGPRKSPSTISNPLQRKYLYHGESLFFREGLIFFFDDRSGKIDTTGDDSGGCHPVVAEMNASPNPRLFAPRPLIIATHSLMWPSGGDRRDGAEVV